jgi:Na+-transporting methylmalonyl-CoA/oxaloacetate decarboxylase gamma subunit
MDGMDTFVVLVIAVSAIIIVSLAGRALGAKSRAAAKGGAAGSAGVPGEAGGELVAVIAAAVAAASGSAPGSFRITSIAASGPLAQGGYNTPVWGHVDRNY